MLKWLIQRRLRAFERKFNYDASYSHAILDADLSAFILFAKVAGFAHYRKDVPRDVHCAVALTVALSEDCGPCTQLGVTLALRDGVAPETISAVLRADDAAMPDDVRLGVRYARAVLARSAEAESLREELTKRYGERGLLSLAFAITGARIFPTMKYALGHGIACQRIVVQGETIPVERRVEKHAA
jgi:hypothetical protein